MRMVLSMRRRHAVDLGLKLDLDEVQDRMAVMSGGGS